jgi:hypothetical protein
MEKNGAGNGFQANIKFPCWVIVNEEVHEKRRLPESLVYVDIPGKKGKALTVFRTARATHSAIENLKLQGAGALAIRSEGELLQVALWCEKEVEYVAIWISRKKLHGIPPKTLIEQIKKRRKSRGT